MSIWRPGVVDVVLAVHLEAHGGQQIRHHRAIGRATAVAHVQRPRGVGRHELHLHALALAEVAAAVVMALGQDLGHHRLVGAGAHEEIDEARAGDLHLRHQIVGRQRLHQPLGQIARLHARGLGQTPAPRWWRNRHGSRRAHARSPARPRRRRATRPGRTRSPGPGTRGLGYGFSSLGVGAGKNRAQGYQEMAMDPKPASSRDPTPDPPDPRPATSVRAGPPSISPTSSMRRSRQAWSSAPARRPAAAGGRGSGRRGAPWARARDPTPRPRCRAAATRSARTVKKGARSVAAAASARTSAWWVNGGRWAARRSVEGGGGEGAVTFADQLDQQRIVRVSRLNQHPAWLFRAAGTAGDLEPAAGQCVRGRGNRRRTGPRRHRVCPPG